MLSKKNVLIIGSGGREYAMAYSLKQSKNPINLYFTGWANPGMLQFGELLKENELKPILNFCLEKEISLVLIGSESKLKWVDSFHKNNIPAFGPREDLARLETDKIFARNLIKNNMNNNWNPDYQIFEASQYPFFPEKEVLEFIENHDYQYVVKKNTICGGKGVKLSGIHFPTIQDGLNYCQELFKEDGCFMIEEKLNGEEFSLHTITDGTTFLHMPVVKDYKRAYDNDMGPNTGSMGSLTFMDHSLPYLNSKDILTAEAMNENAINSIQDYYHESIETNDKKSYRGVLYGSFIKTSDPENPIRIIEFNARFGDPEVINLLATFEGDFLDLVNLTALGKLEEYSKDNFTFKNVNTLVKYLVPNGYPHQPVKDLEIYLNNCQINNSEIYPASVEYRIPENDFKYDKEHVYLRGSRSIALLAQGNESHEDLARKINHHFDLVWGPVFYRKDIGIVPLPKIIPEKNKYSYQQSGVNLVAYQKALDSIKHEVESTFNDSVLSRFGDFGGVFQMPGNQDKVLVASTDGVGTKTKFLISNLESKRVFPILGRDIVNHCVNDILVMGATPLFFLDYYASATICQEHLAELLKGMSDACRQSNTVILGGETAEMPGIYQTDQVDIVGTIVGTANKEDLLKPKENIEVGDLVLALPANGIHTNGYSLVRKITEDHKPTQEVLDRLTLSHRCYLPDIQKIQTHFNKPLSSIINGLSHITGGGLLDNPDRILSNDKQMILFRNKWEFPIEYKFLQEKGKLSDREMYHVFNCGLGMLLITDPFTMEEIQKLLPDSIVVGEIGERHNGENSVKIIK